MSVMKNDNFICSSDISDLFGCFHDTLTLLTLFKSHFLIAGKYIFPDYSGKKFFLTSLSTLGDVAIALINTVSVDFSDGISQPRSIKRR
jgi:hypothetical protein